MGSPMEGPQGRVVTLVVILCAGIFFWRINTVIQDAIEYSYPTVTVERLLIEAGLTVGISLLLGLVYWRWSEIMAMVPGPHEALTKPLPSATKPKKKAKPRRAGKDTPLHEVFVETPSKPMRASGSSPFFVRRP